MNDAAIFDWESKSEGIALTMQQCGGLTYHLFSVRRVDGRHKGMGSQ